MSTGQQTLINRAGAKPGFFAEMRELGGFSHLLYNLVYRDLTVRYKRSALGFLWTLLNPLLLMLIFVVIFSTFFRFAIDHYEIYFLSEYLPWIFFSQTTVGAMASMAWNGPLMKRVRVPRSIFPLSATLSGGVNLLLTFLPLIAIMLVVGAPVRPAMLFLPVSALILAVFTFGLSLILASLAVFVHDLKEIYGVAITALLYLAPIIYPIDIVPAKFRWIIEHNPLTYLFQLFRSPIYEGVLPSIEVVGTSMLLAVVALGIGWATYRRLVNSFYAHL